MPNVTFQNYFTPTGLSTVRQNIAIAIAEDGRDLTAEGVFTHEQRTQAHIVAKEKSIVVGLELIDIIFEEYVNWGGGLCTCKAYVAEGEEVDAGTKVAEIFGACIDILKLERIILNYMCHLSGVANLTAKYVHELRGTSVRLLDTRKTMPGLRWLEKYAVRCGGGHNHRRDLTEILMLKDTHIDACGSISQAVQTLRHKYKPCPPIEVECRTATEVREAVSMNVERIMLDNMPIDGNAPNDLTSCMALIPSSIEIEISGGISMENIRAYALARAGQRSADFISVGRLTHSAETADFSLRISLT